MCYFFLLVHERKKREVDCVKSEKILSTAIIAIHDRKPYGQKKGSVADPDPKDPGFFSHPDPDPKRAKQRTKTSEITHKFSDILFLYYMIFK